ncbi:Olfactory receptor 14I1 [Heterocephalus glaber]|uniref:Olfactory receptor 14I1 n=1 Tax=Heterocephalus glaber TaxID=10181 RepID=G5ARI5_HETGA|nr:Olfactory receptor 14I1 [Heterocephalus glaber]
MDNLTIFPEFLLMDVTSSRELQVLQGVLLLGIYLGALTGSLVTITIIVADTHLYSPMNIFISNVDLVDLGSISVIVPRAMMNSMMGRKTILLTECAAQIFLFILCVAVEIALLVLMSYDHYVAICHPLHYGLIINLSLCSQAAAGSWASSLVYSAIHTGALFRLPFTKINAIQQYFCDIPQILRISSSDVQFCEFVLFSMHSVEARKKAISTCTPQLATLLLFLISGSVALLGPIENKPTCKNLLTAMFYSMVPQFINPIIYCLRNREINAALQRMFSR